jgi:hypothetical protein
MSRIVIATSNRLFSLLTTNKPQAEEECRRPAVLYFFNSTKELH